MVWGGSGHVWAGGVMEVILLTSSIMSPVDGHEGRPDTMAPGSSSHVAQVEHETRSEVEHGSRRREGREGRSFYKAVITTSRNHHPQPPVSHNNDS